MAIVTALPGEKCIIKKKCAKLYTNEVGTLISALKEIKYQTHNGTIVSIQRRSVEEVTPYKETKSEGTILSGRLFVSGNIQ